MTETEAIREATLGETQQELTAGATGAADLYERLRDSAPKEAKVEWRDGDRWAAHLREKLSDLAANENLSDKGCHDAAGYHLEVATKKITRGYQRAAELLRKEARRQELASVPLPDNHDLNTKVKDASALVAIQNEARSLIAKIERREAKRPGVRSLPPCRCRTTRT